MEIIGHCSLEALEIGLPSLLPPRGSSWGSPYQHVVNPRVVDTLPPLSRPGNEALRYLAPEILLQHEAAPEPLKFSVFFHDER